MPSPYWLLAGKAYAATVNPLGIDTNVPSSGISTQTSLANMVTFAGNSVLPTILLIAGVVAVFYTIYAGFLYLTAAGSAEQTKKARQMLINGFIGVVIIVSAFLIIKVAVSIGNSVSNSVK